MNAWVQSRMNPPPPSGLECASLQAVILSGGLARRAAGINKSFMIVEGRPIVGHQIERLGPVFGSRVAVVTNRVKDYDADQIRVLPDLELENNRERRSSLHGMASVLLAFPDRWCFTLSCDMPYADMGVLAREIERLRGAAEKSAGGICGICIRDDKHLRPYHSLIHGCLGPEALRAFNEIDGKGGQISTRHWIESRRDILVVHFNDLGISREEFDRCTMNFNRVPGAKK